MGQRKKWSCNTYQVELLLVQHLAPAFRLDDLLQVACDEKAATATTRTLGLHEYMQTRHGTPKNAAQEAVHGALSL